MADLTNGAHANIILSAFESLRVEADGTAKMLPLYGAPAGEVTFSASTRTFGPYGVQAKIKLTAFTGSLSYQVAEGSALEMIPAADLTAADVARVRAVTAGELRQVATNCFVPNTIVGSAKQFNSRTPHYMRGDGCTSLQIAFANFAAQGSESLPGAAMTVEASIEYPAGTITRVKWLGGNVCTIADGDAGALSDPVAVTIPRGAKFWVRSYTQNANGVPFYTWPTAVAATNRLGAEYAASGLASKVDSGTFSGNVSIAVYPPLIVAQSTRPAGLFIGDSIAAGYTDTQDDESVDIGVVARAVAPHFALIGTPASGTTAAQFVAGSARRRAMVMPYITHVVSEYGFNDLFDANSAASVIAALVQLPPLFPGKKVVQTTITPKTTSTDSWATVANQTAVNGVQRTLLNQSIRAGLPGFESHIDLCGVVESSLDSGKWRVDLGVPTTDGIHPVVAINAWVRRSGVFTPALLNIGAA